MRYDAFSQFVTLETNLKGVRLPWITLDEVTTIAKSQLCGNFTKSMFKRNVFFPVVQEKWSVKPIRKFYLIIFMSGNVNFARCQDKVKARESWERRVYVLMEVAVQSRNCVIYGCETERVREKQKCALLCACARASVCVCDGQSKSAHFYLSFPLSFSSVWAIDWEGGRYGCRKRRERERER